MGWSLGNILGGAAPILGTVLGGPVGGAIGSLAGSLISGGTAQSNANGAAGASSALAHQEAGQYSQYSPSTLSAMLTQSGINPTTGSFDGSYNPAQSLYNSLYGGTSITDRANALYDPAQLQGEMAGYKSASAPAYTSAVTAAQADATNRGFAGNDSALDSATAGIRRQQASDQSGFNTGLLANLNNQKRSYEVGQQQAGQNLLSTGLQDQQNNLKSTESALQGTAQGAMGTFGGLQGFYAGQAANQSSRINSALGQIGASGGFGSGGLFGNLFGTARNQSTSPGTTNAQAATPIDASSEYMTYLMGGG